MRLLKHKRGDTFGGSGVYRDHLEQPLDLTLNNITVESSVLINGRRYPLVCAPVLPQDVPANKGLFRFTADTSLWPAGEALWDLQFSQPAFPFPVVVSTPTVPILIEEDITR